MIRSAKLVAWRRAMFACSRLYRHTCLTFSMRSLNAVPEELRIPEIFLCTRVG